MSVQRKLERKYTPAGKPGFLGEGHIARAVVQGDFAGTDPFILLMDDLLDKKTDEPAGGPHPHAGFETVSLLLEGEIGDEQHKMQGGDLQMMTAGSGIIHTETIEKKTRMRLLQLWLNLPKKDRWTTPRVQDIAADHVPRIAMEGADIRLYSGTLAGVSSPVQNHTPVIIADLRMASAAEIVLRLPAAYTAFLYVLDGDIFVGPDKSLLGRDQVGWLNRFTETGESELRLSTQASPARFVLYAGQPQGDQIVPHGPFIGDNIEDINRLYREFRAGKMQHISTVNDAQRLVW
jgi:quercetin 2,3-dioxygenase